jgi:predicted amidohydrolase
METALVQSELVWENPAENRRHFADLLRPLAGSVDLIVLPEMFTTGFTMNPQNIPTEEGQRTLDWMLEQASLANAALTGSIVFPEGGRHYNRLVFAMPDGTYEQYDKRHTFTLAGEDRVYTRGTGRLQVDFRGFTFCPLICYDLRFPVWSRNTEGYDVLIYVANWPSPRVFAWDTLLQARAIENMSYVLGVNRVGTDPNSLSYSGHTAAYDSLGNCLAFSEGEEILRVSLSKSHLKTTRDSLRFLQDRDRFSLES